jgi:hypothetical protein
MEAETCGIFTSMPDRIERREIPINIISKSSDILTMKNRKCTGSVRAPAGSESIRLPVVLGP